MRAREYAKLSKTTERLFKAIPKTVAKNIQFRISLHTYLVKDEKAKNDFLAKCFIDPRIFFNTCLWVPAPRQDAANTKVPFILYPKQEEAVLKFKAAIDGGYDIIADKSRDEGATFLNIGLGVLYFLIQDYFRMLMGSRVENLVDKATGIRKGMVVGFERCLFYKLLFLINELPEYLKPNIDKSHMFLQNLDNGSAFEGETTNAGFGKGSRARVILVDEAAQIDPTLAQLIFENIMATSNCCILNSTQGPWGSAHPYDKILKLNKTKIVILDWADNPIKNPGMYSTPKNGVVRIHDIQYYRDRWPGVYNSLEPETDYDVSELSGTYPFRADGGVSNFHCKKSPWWDKEEDRPGATRRGLAQNVLRVSAGSSEMFFRYDLLENLRADVREPLYRGNIEYQISDGFVKNEYFDVGGHNSNLSWWSGLPNKRPNQAHNYAIGCDISRGTGASNSVAAIIDVNESTLVGLLVTPYHRQEQFAELVVALCNWVGGVDRPLLSWETNGASDFAARLDELGYYNLWENPDGGSKNRYGWRSSGGPQGTKIAILNSLEAALFESLKEDTDFNYVRIYDEQTINELGQYVFFEGRVDVGPATMQTESSGAKAAHGDRPIALAIAVLCAKDQMEGNIDRRTLVDAGSFMARKLRKEAEEAKHKHDSIEWYY